MFSDTAEVKAGEWCSSFVAVVVVVVIVVYSVQLQHFKDSATFNAYWAIFGVSS